MIRKLLFLTTLFVFLIATTNLFAGVPNASNKLVYFRQFNTFTSSYPVSQSALNFNSSLVSSATIDYGGSGISPINFPRTNWDITNASSTLDPATAPYVEYTINFNSSVNIDLDRFVITGGGSNYSAKFELRWSKDNYATRLGLFSFGSDWQYKLSSVNLNTLSNFIGTQLKFRLYFYDTSPSGFNFVHSDTGPNPSLDGTPSSYDIWTATATVWVNPPPAINTITPSTGAIGSTVVINGTDFTGATTLSFNGTNATNFVVDSPTQITATVPVGTTTGPITVTTPNGTGTSATNFTVVSLPTITSFTPSSGPVGTSVTITGTNFTNTTAVLIGGTPVTSFTINSATSITAVVAAGMSGKIQVTTTGGTADSTSNFTLPPTITTTGTSAITALSGCKSTPSAAQTFTVRGYNLVGNIVFGSDDTSNIEFSRDDTTYYTTFPSLELVPTNGTVVETTIYVRLKSSSSLLTSATKAVTISSTNATSETFSFTRVRNDIPQLTQTSGHALGLEGGGSQNNCINSTPYAFKATATGLDLTYQWYSNTTSSRTGATLITGATSSTYTPVTTTPSALYFYCVVTGTCGSVNTPITGLITVSERAVGGTATAAVSSLCSGNSTTLSLAGHAGTIQWYSSPSTYNGTWSLESTATTLTTPALTSKMYYRATLSSLCSPLSYSTTALVSIIAPIAITAEPSVTAQTYCQNATPTTLFVTATGSVPTYQWYSNTTASTTGAILIAGATARTYIPDTTTPSALYYYCVVTGTCNSVTSNFSGLITVNALPVGGTAMAAASSVCSGTTTTLSLAGNTGSIQWQQSANGTTGWVDVTGGSDATTATYTTSAITGTLYYRASVTVNSCVSYSNVVSVVLGSTTTTRPSTTAQTYCQNATPTDLSVVATGVGLTYQWYSNISASTTGATLISGATSSTYTPLTSTASALYYYCMVTGTCSTITSGFSGLITVNATSVGGTATATATAVCPSATTTITLTGRTGSIQWQQSTDGITGWANVTVGSGTTSATYTTPALTTTTYYRAQVTNSSCSLDYSSVASVAIIPASVGGTATAASSSVCSGTTTTLNLTGHTGSTIQWESSTNGTNGWVNVSGGSGATTTNYTTPIVAGLLYYRAKVTSSPCSGSSYSSVASVSLNVAAAITAQPSITAQTYCQNGSSTLLSVTATGSGLNYQWYSNTTAATTGATLISGATTANYTPLTTAASALYYYCVITGPCSSVTSNFSGLITVNPLPVISGNTTVGIGDTITLTATTTAASSNAWVSSNPTKASVSNLGVVNGWISGTTTITYTNNNGCTDTESITVTAGATQSPSLSFPATNSMAVSTLNFNYSLPETPLANSVQLVFVPTGGGTPIVWIMNNDTSASFSYGVGTNPTSIPNVLSGAVLGFTTYTVTLSYQDAFGNSPSSVTNTNIQIVEAPSISMANNSYTGFVNSALTPISVTSNGGAVSSYAISPSLPSGLILNSTTGAITGTPTAILASTTFTLSATNPAGTVSVTFSLLIDMDTDGDGVPDSVETQQGTNPNLASSYLDTDTDGVPNYIELQQGTNPNVASSYLDTDSDGLSDYYEANNHAPTNSSITTTTISENNSVGDVIGNLSTTDADAGDTHTYTLVSGTGSTDNANFSIVGNELRAGIAFDFETKSTYSIRIKTTDAGGLTFEKVFTVAVTNVNEIPVLSVSQTSYFGVVASPLTIITVTNTGGTATSFAIIPALPSGLFFDTTTGTISGTPTVALVATNFTITATNSAGTASVQFSLLIDIDATNQIVDTDGDGVPDTIDTEDDGDGIIDGNDAFPFDRNEWTDSDSDGTGDNADTDDDNDGVLDTCDVDTNGDGIPDNGIDLDSDGIIDSCDSDMDGDGVNNTSDNCPLLPNINQADRDRDGQGDVCDTIELNISEAITPNGDGINDTWVIYNLNNHPGSTVRVFDTNGVQVFYSANYQNNWAGNYEGKNEMLPVGSYLFQIDLGSDGSKDYQGWLYITK